MGKCWLSHFRKLGSMSTLPKGTSVTTRVYGRGWSVREGVACHGLWPQQRTGLDEGGPFQSCLFPGGVFSRTCSCPQYPQISRCMCTPSALQESLLVCVLPLFSPYRFMLPLRFFIDDPCFCSALAPCMCANLLTSFASAHSSWPG